MPGPPSARDSKNAPTCRGAAACGANGDSDMNRSLFAAAAMVLGSFLITTTGCGGPESTCKKLKELAEKEDKGKDKKKDSADDEKKMMDDCVKKLEEDKKKDPKKFECMSKAVDKANNFEDYIKGMKDCEGEKK